MKSNTAYPTWTDEDFRLVFAFLRDIRACLDDNDLLLRVRDLLKDECEEASRRMSRICDAVCAGR